jgi:hypothetical protein
MIQRKTTAKVAKQASRVLSNIGTRQDAKSSAASALSQRAPLKRQKPSHSTQQK